MSNLYLDNDIVDWTPAQMLEVYLADPDDFLKVKETLSRIGVASKRDVNTLFQSCHILHKQGRYFIVHFKELFMLDGKPSTFTYEDQCRRNTIATLLSDWNLLSLANRASISGTSSLKKIKIISHSDKSNWNLQSKYSIGNVNKKA
jgi:hypothetical protein